MMQQIPEWYQKYNEQESPNEESEREPMMRAEKHPDKPDDEDHEMEEETLPEPDHSSDVEFKPRRETHRNARKRVREKTVDGEITKTTYHIGPAS